MSSLPEKPHPRPKVYGALGTPECGPPSKTAVASRLTSVAMQPQPPHHPLTAPGGPATSRSSCHALLGTADVTLVSSCIFPQDLAAAMGSVQ